VVVPFGKWSDVAGIGFGGLASASFHYWKSVSVTARVGYISHAEKDLNWRYFVDATQSDMAEVPILVGARYYPKPILYFGVELGAAIIINNTTYRYSNGRDDAQTNTVVRCAASAGVGLEIWRLNIAASLFVPNIQIPSTKDYSFPDVPYDDPSVGFMLNLGIGH